MEGGIEEMLLKQQRADSDEIYPEHLDSISSEISRSSTNQRSEGNLRESDDDVYDYLYFYEGIFNISVF